MKKKEKLTTTEKFEKLLVDEKKRTYVLRLYIAGNTAKSAEAVVNIKDICETHLKGRYKLEVIDIYQQASLARGEQIIAAPTLIKFLPLPLKRIIGNLSKTERVIFGLDLRNDDGEPIVKSEKGAT